jgi:hypothetical protein
MPKVAVYMFQRGKTGRERGERSRKIWRGKGKRRERCDTQLYPCIEIGATAFFAFLSDTCPGQGPQWQRPLPAVVFQWHACSGGGTHGSLWFWLECGRMRWRLLTNAKADGDAYVAGTQPMRWVDPDILSGETIP